ncbi:MAG: hypothetical protein DSY81_08535 [Bacillota bacterium]|nr:MAG: hypothetical protein DSY92_03355 [Planctomycetota bacterium]RUA08734.1 MAG: hypothetical protein DSY81_08535 [Bacillota bacterium]
MMFSLLIVLAMALVGLVAGPVIGMLIVELHTRIRTRMEPRRTGSSVSSTGCTPVGFVLGVMLALVVSKKNTEHTE